MPVGSEPRHSPQPFEIANPAPDKSTAEREVSKAESAWMREAVDRALAARAQNGKAGIAAAILLNGQVVGRGENEVRLQSDPTKHAEMVALAEAAKSLDTTDLSSCVMISTLQPCEMCLSAMRFAGIKRVIFGATQQKVAGKYFVFPGLRLADFQAAGEPFEAIGGLYEDDVLPLYENGEE